MASFIMRTLAHTNTRPAGVTSQAAGNSVQISVRTSAPDFAPVANAAVDLFGYGYPAHAEEDSVFETVVVKPFSRTPALKPHHAEVSGGLDAMKNQHEARFGQVVNYTLQLHADPDDPVAQAIDEKQGLMGEHIAVGPDNKGNSYQLRVSVSFLQYEDADNNAGTPETRVGPVAAVATAVSITPSIVAPNSDGALTIPITVPDPHPGVNHDDMQVTFTLTPLGTDPGGGTYNNARVFDAGGRQRRAEDDDSDGYTATFITVIDQYGRPVPRFSVNAVSNGADSVLPFVQYFTTGASGSYSIGYTYSGGPGTEIVTGFGAVRGDYDDNVDTANTLPDRDTNDDGTLDFPAAADVQTAANLLPAADARPAVTMYWADDVAVDDLEDPGDRHHPVVDELRLRPALRPCQLGAHSHVRSADQLRPDT